MSCPSALKGPLSRCVSQYLYIWNVIFCNKEIHSDIVVVASELLLSLTFDMDLFYAGATDIMLPTSVNFCSHWLEPTWNDLRDEMNGLKKWNESNPIGTQTALVCVCKDGYIRWYGVRKSKKAWALKPCLTCECSSYFQLIYILWAFITTQVCGICMGACVCVCKCKCACVRSNLRTRACSCVHKQKRSCQHRRWVSVWAGPPYVSRPT